MALPYFFVSNYSEGQHEIELDENNSRHAVQVLRMKEGEKLNLTDGKGNLLTGEIVNAHKRHCSVKILDSRFTPHDSRQITIAISLLKNTSRFEWFLEKATEIGISEIVPLICERTEKQKIRYERMCEICVSSMLQSQQCWVPVLKKPLRFDELIKSMTEFKGEKFIAHCVHAIKADLISIKSLQEAVILIGPEGDFTNNEIEISIKNDFTPVTLGKTRLRTETAGVVSATLLVNL